ncbi:MAG: acyl carrier protein [Chlamydia sp.]
MADDTLVEKLKKTIAEQLGIDIEKVTEEKSFIEDLNADSLDLTELIMNLETAFDVTISDDQAEKFKTVQDVITFIQSKKG